MIQLASDISVIKDGKRFICTAEQITVSGGLNVIYVADDGSIIKQEPMHRYKQRLRRRNGERGYTLRV